jgi:hypothetical protein
VAATGYVFVYTMAKAVVAPEHRHRRRSGRGAAPGELGGRHGRGRHRRSCIRDYLRLDATALGAVIKYRDDYARARSRCCPSWRRWPKQTANLALREALIGFAAALSARWDGSTGRRRSSWAGVRAAVWRLRSDDGRAAKDVFKASITYLALIFPAVALDQFLLG